MIVDPAAGASLASRLQRALHPLAGTLPDCAWNAGELDDLLPLAQSRSAAAVLVGIIAHRDPTVLLTRRTESLRRHAGEISFPGGRVEAADACGVSAALREAEEEVGLAPEAVQPLGLLDPYDTISGFRVLPVVATIGPGAALRPDPGEVAEAFEVPLAFLLDPCNCERVEGEFRGRVRHYFQFRYAGHRIWGATAAMLVNLRQRLAEVE